MAGSVTREQWSDERLDDMGLALRVLAPVATTVAQMGVRVDHNEAEIARVHVALERIGGKLERIGDKLEARRWSPGLVVALVAPTLSSLIAAVAVVLS